jgi:tyrosine-specific transport protein
MQRFFRHHLVGGTLLISGMSIGVGMLALPVVTAESGFLPAVLIYLLCWLFMVSTGLLIAEALSWAPRGANLITLSRQLLGQLGATITWLLYLFLFFCILVAHLAAGGNALSSLFPSLSSPLASFLYLLLFSPIVLFGTRTVDRFNRFFVSGVIVTYLLFLFFGAPQISFDHLARADWSAAWNSLPVLFIAFGFQNMVPTLVEYMERDFRKVKQAIWIGTTIPLLVYLVWELLILGIVPLEPLQQARLLGTDAVIPLQKALGTHLISLIGQAFALFAMTASYLCIALALLDFLADGLKTKKQGASLALLSLIVFGIPQAIVWIDPTLFLKSLGLAGGFGTMILFGLLPVLYAFIGRYRLHHTTAHPLLPGGKPVLFLITLFALLVIVIELR